MTMDIAGMLRPKNAEAATAQLAAYLLNYPPLRTIHAWDNIRWPSRPSASSATISSLQLQPPQDRTKSPRPPNHLIVEAAIGEMCEMTSHSKKSTRLNNSSPTALASKDIHQRIH